MTEPWDLRQDYTRQPDSLPTFIIFCEDGQIEPEYFRALGSDLVKISPIENCGKQHKQVDYATDYCRKNDLLETVDGNDVLKLDDGAQVWCVFDRDKEENDGKDSTFNNSIRIAESIGIRTAWSNDDFELWILMHFEEIPTDDVSYKHRNKYYQRLTEILKAINPKTEEETKIIDNPNFTYYNTMKSKKRFLGITLQHMKGKGQNALARADALAAFHSDSQKSNHEKSPCTMVHSLVRELILYSKKEI